MRGTGEVNGPERTLILINAGAGQGKSVALSADGNTAIIGGPWDNWPGAAWVFTRSKGLWTQQGNKLVGSGSVVGDDGLMARATMQGWSVALAADGNTAIIGGWGDNGGAGAAWVFTRKDGVWSS